jgi:hypothetical protein
LLEMFLEAKLLATNFFLESYNNLRILCLESSSTTTMTLCHWTSPKCSKVN